MILNRSIPFFFILLSDLPRHLNGTDQNSRCGNTASFPSSPSSAFFSKLNSIFWLLWMTSEWSNQPTNKHRRQGGGKFRPVTPATRDQQLFIPPLTVRNIFSSIKIV